VLVDCWDSEDEVRFSRLSASASVQAMARMRPPLRARHAIVAESRPVLARGLRSALGSAWEVSCIDDGRKVPQVAAQVTPQLVVLDSSLPTLDGIPAVRATHDAAPAAHIVVVNAVSSLKVAGSYLTNGAHGVLAKTASLDQLIGAVHRILGGARLIVLGKRHQYAPVGSHPGHAAVSALSPRLVQVLELIGNGLTAAAIRRGPRYLWAYSGTLPWGNQESPSFAECGGTLSGSIGPCRFDEARRRFNTRRCGSKFVRQGRHGRTALRPFRLCSALTRTDSNHSERR
jgi:DNA-binding NarL/FixJ family response regulator